MYLTATVSKLPSLMPFADIVTIAQIANWATVRRRLSSIILPLFHGHRSRSFAQKETDARLIPTRHPNAAMSAELSQSTSRWPVHQQACPGIGSSA
jgi:hypothetical protein